MTEPYILQKGGSCCALIALLNALRFFGRPTSEPDSDGWDELVDLAACRHGSALGIDEKVCPHLGLERTRIRPEDAVLLAPAQLTVVNPGRGMHLHGVLVIGGNWPALTMVNYRWWAGPVVETAIPELMPHGHPNREAWTIRLAVP